MCLRGPGSVESLCKDLLGAFASENASHPSSPWAPSSQHTGASATPDQRFRCRFRGAILAVADAEEMFFSVMKHFPEAPCSEVEDYPPIQYVLRSAHNQTYTLEADGEGRDL